jgi:hypothetical protein
MGVVPLVFVGRSSLGTKTGALGQRGGRDWLDGTTTG